MRKGKGLTFSFFYSKNLLTLFSYCDTIENALFGAMGVLCPKADFLLENMLIYIEQG